MTKKVSKKKTTKKISTAKPNFPPKLNTKGVKIVGFTVEIHNHTPFVYEGEDHC